MRSLGLGYAARAGLFAILLLGCGGQTLSENVEPSPRGEAPPSTVVPSPPTAPRPATTVPSNDRCSTPTRIALANGQAFVLGDTSTASDEFPSLDCGSRGTAATLKGPQRYYLLPVRKDRTYRFSLTPWFHAVFVGFESSVECTPAAIQLACRGRSARGFASGLINPGTGKPGHTVFETPPLYRAERDTELILVVDSDGGSGKFELTIVEE